MTAKILGEGEKRLVIFALLVVILLGALDMTILAPALPRIIEDLGGMEYYAWVSASYMLTSTVLIPIYGKLGDIYGRKPVLIIGIVIFQIGSVLCGLAGEFGPLPVLGESIHQLIYARAIKGVGGAALFTCAFAIVADIFEPAQRTRLMGLFSAVMGLASILGPLVGGFFTDAADVQILGHEIAGWRWVFYVPIPLGFIALHLVATKAPPTNKPVGGKVDVAGAVLITTLFVPLLLALTWGGQSHAWNSSMILTLLSCSSISLGLFLWVENRVTQPIFPLDLFRVKLFSVANLGGFCLNIAFFGMVTFIPLYLQVVLQASATTSGLVLFPLMVGMTAGSVASAQLASRLGYYKSFIIGGGLLLLLGMLGLSFFGPDNTAWQVAACMLLFGIGLGPSQSLMMPMVQAAVPVADIGTATSGLQFSRQIGSSVGVALFGAVLSASLLRELPLQVPVLPGAAVQAPDINLAQSEAMQPAAVKQRVQAHFDAIYEDAINTAAEPPGASLDTELLQLKQQLDQAAEEMSGQTQRGLLLAFSNATTALFSLALWISILAVVIFSFLPAFSLHSEQSE